MAETQTPVSAFDAVIKIRYLDDTNAVFTEQEGFLSLKTTLPNDEGTEEEQTYERVFLHSAFPFDMPHS